jgi:hypothetical protein
MSEAGGLNPTRRSLICNVRKRDYVFSWERQWELRLEEAGSGMRETLLQADKHGSRHFKLEER